VPMRGDRVDLRSHVKSIGSRSQCVTTRSRNGKSEGFTAIRSSGCTADDDTHCAVSSLPARGGSGTNLSRGRR
jgi:hypothetical protein